jgi:hypothetical protein
MHNHPLLQVIPLLGILREAVPDVLVSVMLWYSIKIALISTRFELAIERQIYTMAPRISYVYTGTLDKSTLQKGFDFMVKHDTIYIKVVEYLAFVRTAKSTDAQIPSFLASGSSTLLLWIFLIKFNPKPFRKSLQEIVCEPFEIIYRKRRFVMAYILLVITFFAAIYIDEEQTENFFGRFFGESRNKGPIDVADIDLAKY